jgi:myo-inositol-1(or 4)-monophosphatase
MENKSPELEVAIKAALEAGEVLLRHQDGDIDRGIKEDKSMVTLADVESEEIIKKIITESFAEHSFFGEETEVVKKSGPYAWYVDPVDGSRNFAHKIPFFAISISLLKDKDIILGVVYNPATNSLFYAEKGKGAYLNDKLVHVSKADTKKCIVTVSSGRKEEYLKLKRNLLHDLPDNIVSSVRDFACTSLDLAHVASGRTEADIKFGFKVYDAAAGILLVREAGGTVTNIEGKEWCFEDDGSFIASNGLFHDTLIEEVKRQKERLNIL